MNDEPAAYVDPPFRHLCREIKLGLTGELAFENDQLRLKFVSWNDGHFFRGAIQNFCLELEDGQCATLIECVPQEWSAHFLECNANLAILGRRPWTEEDRVRRLSFAFWAGREALHYNDHVEDGIEALGDLGDALPTLLPSKIPRSKLLIVQANSRVARVSVGLDAVVGFDRFRPGPRFRPFVTVEFLEPTQIDAARRFARHVLTFFEISVGVRSRMIDVRVDTQTSEARNARIASGDDPDEFSIRVPHGSWGNTDLAPKGSAVFPVHSSDERRLTAENLGVWIDRLPDWEPSYALASLYLTIRSQFNRDRLLRLAAWFESLPIGSRQSGISKAHRDAITHAAQAEAVKLGLAEHAERVREVMQALAKKPLKGQLCDVAAELRLRFPNLLPEEIQVDLQHFAKLRNDAAHGRIALHDDDAAKNIRAMRALELVCLLAMLSGLSVSDATAKNVVRHLLAHYAMWR